MASQGQMSPRTQGGAANAAAVLVSPPGIVRNAGVGRAGNLASGGVPAPVIMAPTPVIGVALVEPAPVIPAPVVLVVDMASACAALVNLFAHRLQWPVVDLVSPGTAPVEAVRCDPLRWNVEFAPVPGSCLGHVKSISSGQKQRTMLCL